MCGQGVKEKKTQNRQKIKMNSASEEMRMISGGRMGENNKQGERKGKKEMEEWKRTNI